MQAGMQKAPASAQPTRRGPMADVRLGHGDGQHEREERGRRRRRRLGRNDPRKEHGEADQRHGDDGGDLVGRDDGAEQR